MGEDILFTYDLRPMIDIARTKSNHFPLSVIPMNDPHLKRHDQHHFAYLHHHNQDFWFHCVFMNHSHVSFFNSKGELLKAWHYAKLVSGHDSAHIPLLRIHPKDANLDDNHTSQERPGRTEIRTERIRHLEGWELHKKWSLK